MTDINKVQLVSFQNGMLRLMENTSNSNIIINVLNDKNLKVIFSDGSEVLLNARTQISLESAFLKINSRIVALIGQAFL